MEMPKSRLKIKDENWNKKIEVEKLTEIEKHS